jgi:hypothetical protein
MRWAGHVACGGSERCTQWLWWGDLRERDHFEDLGVNGRIILKWIFKTWVGEWARMIELRLRIGGRLL